MLPPLKLGPPAPPPPPPPLFFLRLCLLNRFLFLEEEFPPPSFVSVGANTLRVDPQFARDSKQEVTKVVSLNRKCGKTRRYTQIPSLI